MRATRRKALAAGLHEPRWAEGRKRLLRYLLGQVLQVAGPTASESEEALSLLPDDSKVAEALLPTHYHGEGGGWAAALPELLNMLPHMKADVGSSKLCGKLVDAVAAAVAHKLIPMQDLLKMIIALKTPAAGAGALMAKHVARLVLELYIDQYMSGDEHAPDSWALYASESPDDGKHATISVKEIVASFADQSCRHERMSYKLLCVKPIIAAADAHQGNGGSQRLCSPDRAVVDTGMLRQLPQTMLMYLLRHRQAWADPIRLFEQGQHPRHWLMRNPGQVALVAGAVQALDDLVGRLGYRTIWSIQDLGRLGPAVLPDGTDRLQKLQAILEACLNTLVKHGPLQMGLFCITAHLEAGMVDETDHDGLFHQGALFLFELVFWHVVTLKDLLQAIDKDQSLAALDTSNTLCQALFHRLHTFLADSEAVMARPHGPCLPGLDNEDMLEGLLTCCLPDYGMLPFTQAGAELVSGALERAFRKYTWLPESERDMMKHMLMHQCP